MLLPGACSKKYLLIHVCLKPTMCLFPNLENVCLWLTADDDIQCLIWMSTFNQVDLKFKKMHRFHCVLVYYRHINDVFNICRFCLFCEYNFAMQMFLKIQSSTTINQSLRTPRRLVRDSIYEIWEIQYLNKPVKSWILKHVS